MRLASIAVLALAVSAFPAHAVIYNSTDVNRPVPDVSTTTSILNVTSNGFVQDLNVNLDMTHTWIGDLVITLVHIPTGRSATLFSHSCGSADNIRATFDDEAVLTICGNNNSYATVLPVSALSAFDGINPYGQWDLIIADTVGLDSGWLYAWGLDIFGFPVFTDMIGPGATRNQQAVAMVLTAAGLAAPSSDMATVLGELSGMSVPELKAALDQLGGQTLHTAVPMMSVGMIETYQKSIQSRMISLQRENRRMAQAGTGSPEGVKLAMAGDGAGMGMTGSHSPLLRNLWLQTYASTVAVDGDKNASGYDYDLKGIAAGVDFPVAKGLNLGVSFGYGSGDLKTNTRDAADIKSIQLSAYGTYDNGPFYANGMFTYAFSEYDTSRTIAIGTDIRSADGEYNGKEWAASAEVGYTAAISKLSLQPFIGTRYVNVTGDGFREKGADDVSLKVRNRSSHSWKAFAGAKAFTEMKAGDKALFIPEVSVKYVREFGDNRETVSASFVGAPAAGRFSVRGVDIGRDSVEITGGFKIFNGRNLKVGLDLGSEFNADRTSYTAAVGLTYMF